MTLAVSRPPPQAPRVVLELMLLVITGTYLPPLVWLWVRHGDARGMRHEGFEAWCRAKPVVAALHCPREGADAAADRLGWVARREWLNVRGGFPWGNYSVALQAEVLSPDVVALRVARVRRLRGTADPPALEALTRSLSSGSEEVWLHGELWSDDASPHPPEVSWRAGHDPRDGLRVMRVTTQPWWLVQATTRKPPRPDGHGDEHERALGLSSASAS